MADNGWQMNERDIKDLIDKLIDKVTEEHNNVHSLLNLRVSAIEKFTYLLTGGLIVIGILAVPLFINLVNSGGK